MKESSNDYDLDRIPTTSDLNIDIGAPKETGYENDSVGQNIVDNMNDVTERIRQAQNKIDSLKLKIGKEEEVNKLRSLIEELEIDRANLQDELDAYEAKKA